MLIAWVIKIRLAETADRRVGVTAELGAVRIKWTLSLDTEDVVEWHIEKKGEQSHE